MKKYLLGIIAVVFALGAFAFQQVPTSAVDDVYYWYDSETGILLSETPSEMPGNGCVLQGDPLCAYGHSQPTSTPGINFQTRAYFP